MSHVDTVPPSVPWLVIKTTVVNELRLRLRRLSTLVSLFAVIVMTWLIIPDPKTGMTLIAVKEARALYDSNTLALGSAVMASLLLALGGFYLVRGRMTEDLRYGTGALLASTAMSNRLFLYSRWCANVAFLLTLLLVFTLTMFVLHGLRGEAPLHITTYLKMYAGVMGPSILFISAMAVLFDSIPFLMGRAGDILYFFFWTLSISTFAGMNEGKVMDYHWLMMFDYSGIATMVVSVTQGFSTDSVSVGMSDFNTALAPVIMPGQVWSAKLLILRTIAACLSVIPLWLATLFFHRFNPDRVKVKSAKKSGRWAFLNRWSRPLVRFVYPVLHVAARLPSLPRQVLSDFALTLIRQPIAIALLLVCLLVSSFVGRQQLTDFIIVLAAIWGVLISDLITHDSESGTTGLQAVLEGGAMRHLSRHFLGALTLGLAFCAPTIIRLAMYSPHTLLSLLTGLFFLSSWASLLGLLTKGSRTYLSLYLFGLYLALNMKGVPEMNFIGFYGPALPVVVLGYAAAGLAAISLAYFTLARRVAHS